ncbi:uncharacterized protein MKK02DRAFT_22219 [Dioszegia hungarica]|uniref:Uncharacterized protein n=1 Tax=Dioszegia hungarica TaxID=4972 RepID=A0AA38HEU6_9TREE|nr:uncharacterized protein MKK02DRAFT_22219 [Dioszegia hungarica]KAI9638194.1 hypothetical protein MKK02DRAFT_22219 [Dioszegia hungarica]
MWRLILLIALPLSLAAQHPFTPAPRVNVTLYVMSRCPDARTCEAVFEQVLGSQSVQNKVHLKMNYIATRNASEPLGYTCKHGALECVGNAHQLCLHKHLPLPTFYANLGCQNRDFADIGKLSLTKRCADASGVDWNASGVGACIEGSEAEALLQNNLAQTIADGVTMSCTISIDSTIMRGARRCTVDGGMWSGCNDGHTAADFVRVIQEEWRHL